ncbi:MAG: dTMP kinase [Legionellaceae bacterium]|nr:dTMP kinase [Legionellaceae bacterium]
MNKGKFIVIEGLEGAGKSSAMETVSRLLSDYDIPVQTVREPGGTEIAEEIRYMIKKDYREPLYAEAELLLMFAARVQLIQSVISPQLTAGHWILADRFVWSSYAYQGYGRGLQSTMIDQLARFCLSGIEPDLILFLDVMPQVGLQRAARRGAKDRIEQESLDFFAKVRAGYQQLLANTPHSVRIDAHQTMDVVQQHIRQVICDRLL